MLGLGSCIDSIATRLGWDLSGLRLSRISAEIKSDANFPDCVGGIRRTCRQKEFLPTDAKFLPTYLFDQAVVEEPLRIGILGLGVVEKLK